MITGRLTELNKDEILHYLGMNRKNLDTGMECMLDECMENVVKAAKPALVYKRLPVNCGQVEGLSLEGQDIGRILGKADEAVVFAATVGSDVDRLISRTQVTDMARAVIMDACASAAVENICENFESDMRLEVEMEGYFLTERYSPGYGDLPLKSQLQIGEFLNTQRRIGMVVADNCMMNPIKSVTAIMGITKEAVTCIIHRCESCSSKDTCKLRKARINEH